MFRRISLILTGLLLSLASFSQILKPARLSFSVSPARVKAGDEAELVIRAEIDRNWHLYSNDFVLDPGPKPARFEFLPQPGYVLVGKVRPVNPREHFDEVFEGKVRYFENRGEFRQKIKILKPVASIKGNYTVQVCDDNIGKCVDLEDDMEFFPEVTGEGKDNPVPAGEPKQDKTPAPEAASPPPPADSSSATDTAAVSSAATGVAQDTPPVPAPEVVTEAGAAPGVPDESEGLWVFFLAAFVSGLAALLTPCVFPMIPMTVTFFTRQSTSRAGATGKAGFYGFSIILLYVLIGTAVSWLNGPEFANFISTHWAPNLFFFLIFIVFGLSFLGLFEIVLPSSLVNMADRQSDKGGIYGIFFMAFTIVLVSFSCTGPIVGSILVQSAGGAFLRPIVGMLGYSLAFALPFTLFAIFPQWLSNLPRSGGWLNSVKVTLGFLELAFALKFFSIPDLAYHWGILNRDVYLALWIVIFAMLGFYLMGKIRLPHDSPVEKIPVLRLMLAILVFGFVVYLIPGMWGAPLRSLSGYLPPKSTMEFRFGSASGEAEPPPAGLCEAPRHASFLHFPPDLGLQGYFDLRQALACARSLNKPVFIDFTGHGCVNCREMEDRVWSHPGVLKRLKEDFVMLALYVDDKTELPEKEWYTSPYDSKVKKTIGKQNADYQVRFYQSNSQPLYVLLRPDGSLLVPPRPYNLNTDEFMAFLESGKKAFARTPEQPQTP